MEKIYIERLKVWALHLRDGQLKTAVKAINDDPLIEDKGDYIEEAIPFFIYPMKELPYLFKEWKTDKDGNPFWKNDEDEHPVSSTLYFFDMPFDIFQHLFSPGIQNIKRYRGNILSKSASPQEIAHNMLEIIKIISQ